MQDYRQIVTDTIKARGISQNKLSKLSGVPQPRINEWLGGIHESIHSKSLERICAALGLKLTD